MIQKDLLREHSLLWEPWQPYELNPRFYHLVTGNIKQQKLSSLCFLSQPAPNRKKRGAGQNRDKHNVCIFPKFSNHISDPYLPGAEWVKRWRDVGSVNQALIPWTYMRDNGVGKSHSHLTLFARTCLKK